MLVSPNLVSRNFNLILGSSLSYVYILSRGKQKIQWRRWWSSGAVQIVISIMVGWLVLNRRRNFCILGTKRSRGLESQLNQTHPYCLTADDERATQYVPYDPEAQTFCGKPIEIPDSSRWSHHIHSRIIQKFPFLVEILYWGNQLLVLFNHQSRVAMATTSNYRCCPSCPGSRHQYNELWTSMNFSFRLCHRRSWLPSLLRQKLPYCDDIFQSSLLSHTYPRVCSVSNAPLLFMTVRKLCTDSLINFITLAIVYPSIVLFVIVATANHYWLDAVVAILTITVCFWSNRMLLLLLPIEFGICWLLKLSKPILTTGILCNQNCRGRAQERVLEIQA